MPIEPRNTTITARLESIDCARGFAALCVVIWHFQHFYMFGGGELATNLRPLQPFYQALKPIYEHGWMAVDLFFVLSGFIFFWLYAGTIGERRISPGRFFWLRFSRLYPLALATLVIVAVLNAAYLQATGRYFVYPFNDLRHFFLNLTFLQASGLQAGPSFNGPTWSISIEAMLYVVFFALARGRLARNLWVVLGLMLAGMALQFIWSLLGRGVAGFFAGGVVYHLTTRASASVHARRWAWLSVALMVAAWGVTLAQGYLDVTNGLFAGMFGGKLQRLLDLAQSRAVLVVVFPLTVAALVLAERELGVRFQRLRLLGDISYSSYLIHFPMQLAVALLVAHGLLSPAVVQSPLGLVLFFAVLIPLSWGAHGGFEMPAQAFLRRWRMPKFLGAVAPEV